MIGLHLFHLLWFVVLELFFVVYNILCCLLYTRIKERKYVVLEPSRPTDYGTKCHDDNDTFIFFDVNA